MNLGIVLGSVTCTIQHPSYLGRKLMVVELCKPDWSPLKKEVLAVDTVNAGLGDRVLLLKEGNSARLILGDPNPPLQELIVAVVDNVSLIKKSNGGGESHVSKRTTG